MRPCIRYLLGGGSILLFGFIQPAFADAIDGDWCRADGKRMTIRGPAIVTPGGQQTNGDYSRHFFSYVIPPSEAGAGATVSIQLLQANTWLMRAKVLTVCCRNGDGASLE